MVDHLAAVLGLTEAQKVTASKLHASLETEAVPLIQQSRQQWAEIEMLLESANPDATEIGEKMIAAHATQARLKALHDDFHARLSTILTADQTAKLGQLEAARRQREGGRPGPPPPGI
jgi:Spy/CpxP family protein refolding chaperone